MHLKSKIDAFVKNAFVKIECSPEMVAYLNLKALTSYLRSKFIRYEYSITPFPSEEITNIYMNYNSLGSAFFNIKEEKCSTCILNEFNKFINCKTEFVSLFEYIKEIKSKFLSSCDLCFNLYQEIFLTEKKVNYPIYLFHNASTLYLSLYHDLSFIRNNYKRNINNSIKYYLAQEGISISDSLQKFNTNVKLKEQLVNKVSSLENYLIFLNELIKATKKQNSVLQEKSNKKIKNDFLMEENKKMVFFSAEKCLLEGMDLYYYITEKMIEILNHKSVRRGYVLLSKDVICDNLVLFVHFYEFFRYFKSEVLFLCENGFCIYNKKFNINGTFLTKNVILLEEGEIKKIVDNFNK